MPVSRRPPSCSFREQFCLPSSSRRSPQGRGGSRAPGGGTDLRLTPWTQGAPPAREAGLPIPPGPCPVQGGAQPCVCLKGLRGPWSPGCLWQAAFLISSDNLNPREEDMAARTVLTGGHPRPGLWSPGKGEPAQDGAEAPRLEGEGA